MKFLLDQHQSLLLADLLNAVGHDAIHTRDIGLSRAPDVDVLTRAKLDGRVLITADTDFGELLARRGDDAPSVLLLRRHDRRRAEAVAELIWRTSTRSTPISPRERSSSSTAIASGSARCRSIRRDNAGALACHGCSEGPR